MLDASEIFISSTETQLIRDGLAHLYALHSQLDGHISCQLISKQSERIFADKTKSVKLSPYRVYLNHLLRHVPAHTDFIDQLCKLHQGSLNFLVQQVQNLVWQSKHITLHHVKGTSARQIHLYIHQNEVFLSLKYGSCLYINPEHDHLRIINHQGKLIAIDLSAINLENNCYKYKKKVYPLRSIIDTQVIVNVERSGQINKPYVQLQTHVTDSITTNFTLTEQDSRDPRIAIIKAHEQLLQQIRRYQRQLHHRLARSRKDTLATVKYFALRVCEQYLLDFDLDKIKQLLENKTAMAGIFRHHTRDLVQQAARITHAYQLKH